MASPESTTSRPDGEQKQAAPSISLPKGGGAIRGIGEKFAANPITGTGSMSVPIATSPGRSGFGPQLALSFNSGAGNGPFGFGWSLSLPSITRKTDKGLPQYNDAAESDVFILSGAEDLVPVLKQQGNDWVPEDVPDRTVDGHTYRIQRYRPRIEGLFARIRWGLFRIQLMRSEYPALLREYSLATAAFGSTRRALKSANKSCIVAKKQGAKFECAKSLLVCGQLGKELGRADAAQQMVKAETYLAEFERQIDKATAESFGHISNASTSNSGIEV